MPQQKGILPLKGTMGNITFYKSSDGYLAREKGGVDGKRIASDPAFQRTRENGAEFGRAGKAGKILRNSIRSLLQNASDDKMVSRLTREMIKVIQADKESSRGMRNIIDGEIELLEGFDFNINGKLSTTFYGLYTGVIDRLAGTLKVNIKEFVPVNMVNAPQGTTHFKINSAGVEIDFEAIKFLTDINSSKELKFGSDSEPAFELTNGVTIASTHPLFLLMGIEFFQEINGSMYSLKNGAFNSLSLIKISGS